MPDYRIMSVMTDRHQQEHKKLEFIANQAEWTQDIAYLIPAVVSRMAWLEYQAKLKVESILNLCHTGE